MAGPRACGAKPVSWREQFAPQKAVTGLLTIRLVDGRVVALLPGQGGRLANPAFSPDGRRLAFLSNANRVTAQLAVCDLHRNSTSTLELPVSAANFPLSWSKDGRSLLFLGGGRHRVRSRSEAVRGPGGEPAPEEHRQQHGLVLGRSRAVARRPEARAAPRAEVPGRRGAERLVVFDLATKTWERIVGSRQVAQIDAMSWSPDGRELVFSAYKHDEHGDLYVADVATKRIRPLLTSRAGERRPAWSPDGRWIAYERSLVGRPRETSIWAVDVETGRTYRVTSGRADVSPAWSSDGREIAFVRRG